MRWIILMLMVTFIGCSMIGYQSKDYDMNREHVTTDFVETKDKKKIAYDHYKNGHEKVIILAHGFFNSKQAVLFRDMADMLSDRYDVIVFDFRGHGKSSGLFTWTAKEFMDLEAVLDYADKHYDRIGVVGFSLGAATSIITSSKNEKVDSLIAVSPPTKFRRVDGHFWTFGIEENVVYNILGEGKIGKGVRPGLLWHKKIHPIDVVSKIKVPVLLVHGKKDWLIRPWHSEKLSDKIKETDRVTYIDEATHAEYIFRRDKEGTIKIFKDWFEKTL